MKKHNRIIVALSTMALLFSLSFSTVFAAPIGSGVANSSDTSITVPKGVTFINEDSVDCYGPGVSFSYTLAPATVATGTTVTDANNAVGTVHAGPANGLVLNSSTVTFAATEVFTSSATGVEAKKNIEMTADLSKFSQPGIYRYVLTDVTPTSDLYNAGIIRDADYQTARYIDVFVRRNASGNLEVSGYALKTTNDSTTASTTKDPGYVVASAVEDGDPADTDRYKTYNVSVKKLVDGGMADNSHEFPFAITVSNNGHSYFAGEGTTAATAATSLNATLKHNDVYDIKGLSPHATVAVVETNDTPDAYQVSVAGATSAITVSEDSAAKTYSIAAAAVSTYDDRNSATSVAVVGEDTNYKEITYTNTLIEVSPTGFAQHFGQLIAIAIAAIIMLVLATKTTEDEEI